MGFLVLPGNFSGVLNGTYASLSSYIDRIRAYIKEEYEKSKEGKEDFHTDLPPFDEWTTPEQVQTLLTQELLCIPSDFSRNMKHYPDTLFFSGRSPTGVRNVRLWSVSV